ncbi:MAG: YggU family protein [Candidatus Methanomethylophilaceae archaeon]|nr:YggU family protein [Candidatus Methanomethylophilaceae archaeon]
MDITVADVCRGRGDRTEVDITVSPRSNRSGVEGIDGWRRRLIVRVKSPPLDGRANKEVAALFKEVTGFPSEVTAGQTSHQKTVTVAGPLDEVVAGLERARDGRRRTRGVAVRASGRAARGGRGQDDTRGREEGRRIPSRSWHRRRLLLRPIRRRSGQGRGGGMEGRGSDSDPHGLGHARRRPC